MSQLSFAEQQPQISANAAAAPVLTPRSPSPSTDVTPRPSVRQSYLRSAFHNTVAWATSSARHLWYMFVHDHHVLFDIFLALGGFATLIFYYLRVKSYLRFGAGLGFLSAMEVTTFIPRPSLRPTVK
ncbi:hypothetical protein MVLG_01471 [Microbotryum lychnidis-dioicae p1A1 Lamole]|uniref:Uncharacterized protein n=1 Tax=Microbotryum lychnidis-dioicae (strain p1A1 Lamole / MvSl-1064) TaxID=683840 RepID=U5H281_USTV1|nr:hypothetical protein MVLG_01471 [Microbotryum lychnidis-dioicae p1A1 Lamole]|eukprot:KDE08436.1 hypothetical protein MVLG_01471 [Microbotryum lychnidis-dioicae p1A1 Lamole]